MISEEMYKRINKGSYSYFNVLGLKIKFLFSIDKYLYQIDDHNYFFFVFGNEMSFLSNSS